MKTTIKIQKNYVRFVFASGCLYEGSCLAYVICVYLRVIVSNPCCVFVFIRLVYHMLPVF